MSLSRYRIGYGFNRTLRGQGSLPGRRGSRPAPQITNQDWILSTTTNSTRGSIDYFGKYRYESSSDGWRPRNGVWVVDEKPPVFWVFHPLQASSFKFDLYASDANWTKGALVASSGWQKSAIWYPDSNIALTGTHYLLEVQYRAGSSNYRLVGERAIRVFIPSDTPTVERIKAADLRALFETYPTQTIEAGMVRRSVFGRLLNEIRTKYNQAAADPTAYPITYYAVARQLGTALWESATHRISKTNIQALCDRQIELETAVDTNDPNYTEPPTPDSYRFIFDPRNDRNNKSVIYYDGFYAGFTDIEQYLNFLMAVAIFHPTATERETAYHLIRIFIRTLIERVWTNNRGETLSSHVKFSNPDNAAYAIGALAVLYDLLYSEFIENDSFTIRLFGHNMPIKKAIPVFLKAYLEQRYFPSEYYRNLASGLPSGILPEEIASIRPFESHRHRNHRVYFLVMLVLNQLLGWDNWTERVRRELDRLYATNVPWAINDFGYNEGCGYLLAYLGTYAAHVSLLQAAGVPCHQIRRVDRCAWDLVYTGPYGAQEWTPGESGFTRPPLYDPHNWANFQTFVLFSRIIAGTTAKPGTPEAQIFRTYASSNNFQGVHLSQTIYADRLPNAWLPILLTPTVGEMLESPAPSQPLTNAPDFLISKQTKIAHIPTDFRTDQREDTPTGKPKMIVRFYGQRLRRQSHMRNTVNDIQIVAGGEHLLGMTLYGYSYHETFSGEWGRSSVGYTSPLVMPQGSSFTDPFAGSNQWYWGTTFGTVLIRRNQRIVNDPPTVSLTEMLTQEGALVHNAQTISRWVYLENEGTESYQTNLMNRFVRRVVVLPDIPLVVVLDEVRPQNDSAVLWNWYGWSYLYQFDPNIPNGTNLDRNQTPFFDFSRTNNYLRVRVNGCRAGANYQYLSSPSHPEHVPRLAAVFGALGDPNFSNLYLSGKVYRPFEPNTIYRDPDWNGNEFNQTNPDARNAASVPHPLAVWTTAVPSSTHMNDSVGFLSANQTYRAAFWCAPYRIRSVDGQALIPNAHTNNDWIAHRNETPSEVQVGVFNNAPSAKYGVIVKFRKSGYTETNAVSLEYIPNQSAWDSFTGMQSG